VGTAASLPACTLAISVVVEGLSIIVERGSATFASSALQSSDGVGEVVPLRSSAITGMRLRLFRKITAIAMLLG